MRHRCRPPSFYGVQDVLPLRDPLQVLQVVVVSIPVFVVNHQARVIAEKRLSDKPVDISPNRFFTALQQNLAVPLVASCLQKPWTCAKQPFNSALRRNYVALFKANNG